MTEFEPIEPDPNDTQSRRSIVEWAEAYCFQQLVAACGIPAALMAGPAGDGEPEDEFDGR